MRLSELDFLRGIAILLVLFSHHYLFEPLYRLGWIGVDMFFVLSGFLVSGLLFKEYNRFGEVKTKLFLIRRAFKIYPAFYASLIITVCLLYFFPAASYFPSENYLVLNAKGLLAGFIVEALFLQSYVFGFWGHHWSLSVEEMFYILLAILIYVLVRTNRIENRTLFVRLSIFIFSISLILRLFATYNFTGTWTFTASHLRFDELFAGVLISYLYHFEKEKLERFYNKFRWLILLSTAPLLSFTPFTPQLPAMFLNTIGLSLITLAFSFLLLVFIFEPNIDKKVSRIVSKPLYWTVTKIGFYSYGVYLFHNYIVRYVTVEHYAYNQYQSGNWHYWQVVLSFTVYFILSLILGIGMSKLIEIPFLKMRDRWFPKRQ